MTRTAFEFQPGNPASTPKQRVFCLDVDGKTTKRVELPIHHILMLDRSGSMSGSIVDLIENVKEVVGLISEKDFLSVIWFSGPGQHRTVLKGSVKSAQDSIFKVLDGLKSTVGTTCFSESLSSLKEIIDDLKDVCPTVSVVLFTDGEPCVPWSAQEEENRMKTIVSSLKKSIIALTTVGYRSYYNKELLKTIAEMTDFGRHIHSSDVREYSKIFREVFGRVKNADIRPLSVTYAGEILYVAGDATKLSFNEMNIQYSSPLANRLYFLGGGDSAVVNGEAISLQVAKAPEATVRSEFYYALAYEYLYAGRQQEALDVLGYCARDAFLVDSALNAFTSEERQTAEDAVRKAVFDTGSRLIKGSLPSTFSFNENAYCFFDLIQDLQASEAEYQPVKDYERISVKTEDKDDRFALTPGQDIWSSFDNLVVSSEKMNVSIRYTMEGKVKLNAKLAEANGLPAEVDSFIYRMQSLLKDGAIHVKKFSIRTSDMELVQKLSSHKIVTSTTALDGKYVLSLDITSLPIVNRSCINLSNDLGSILKAFAEVNRLKADQKVLKYYIDKNEEANAASKKVGFFKSMNKDQIALLEAHGVSSSGSYSGTERERTPSGEDDFYVTRKIEFALPGWSSLPKVEDVLSKIDSGKPMTGPTEAMALKVAELKSLGLLENANKKTTDALRDMLRVVKASISGLSAQMAMIKTAKILTGSWWSGLSVNEKGQYVFDSPDGTLLIKLDREKVYL